MDLRHLRYFVAVAELGSVSRAAEKLFIAQPPLSLQIRQLEDELGARLLIRYPRGVRLTATGARFLEQAKDVLARADRAKRMARESGDAVAGGLVRIGFVPSAGHTVLPKLVRRLRALRPQVELDVWEMITSRQVRALESGEIDAGIARPPIGTGRAACAVELGDPFCLAIPEGHPLQGRGPIDLRAASEAVFVAFTRHRGPAFFDQTTGLCTDAGFSPEIRYEASTLYGVLDLVGAGLGVALVPASSASLAQPGVMLRVLRKPSRAGALAFVQLAGDPNPLVEILAGLAEGVFAELEAELRGRVVGLR
jgi:DNA-binding transcriptional LysR family regulator